MGRLAVLAGAPLAAGRRGHWDTVLFVDVFTALIPAPLFGREIALAGWACPVPLVTVVLSGPHVRESVR